MRVTIAKRVPVAAGMGGGSADAAAVLRLAARASGLGSRGRCCSEIAAELGADVPGARWSRGARWRREPASASSGSLPRAGPRGRRAAGRRRAVDRRRVRARPTGWDCRARRGRPRRSARGRSRALVAGALLPQDLMVNDLEPAARSLCPAIDDALDAARPSGRRPRAGQRLGADGRGAVLGADAGRARARPRRRCASAARGDRGRARRGGRVVKPALLVAAAAARAPSSGCAGARRLSKEHAGAGAVAVVGLVARRHRGSCNLAEHREADRGRRARRSGRTRTCWSA